ncbi:MAG TPA: twin-arginine translocase TatA/TatE family subunit [Anaerolineae bacterium]|nr:twin-arginine translocase TatA/TatE family subunit [Anaerolineae bacterium]
MQFGPTELLIILVIVVLLFGVGRIGKIGKELGSGMREFRKGLQGDEENKPAEPPANNDQTPKS